MKRLIALLVLIFIIVLGYLFFKSNPDSPKIESKIVLSDETITVNGKAISNNSSDSVYSANDIVFYLAGQDHTYGEGTKNDEHEQAEADKHTVIHITKPGRYSVSGKLSFGQIAIDLGKDAKKDPDAKVTLILNGVDISCTVAPTVIFYNVYECSDNNVDNASMNVDTSNAGANVVIADGTVNNINGSYVAKIYKSVELDESGTKVTDSKKLHKYDAAFYSIQSMNVDCQAKGDGILNINAENEGLDTELHLTINGGNINITSGNDGINTNEDNVSVTTINGGNINILCNGKTGEGDGIDSNGWLVINGGTVNSQACATSADAGIDSDMGIYINGGTVIASGNMLDRIAGGNQHYAVFNFPSKQVGSNTYTVKDKNGDTVIEYTPQNSFSSLIVSSGKMLPEPYTVWLGNTQISSSDTNNMQGGMPHGNRPDRPNGEFPQGGRPDMPNGEFPQGGRPDMPNGEFPQDGRPDMPNGEFPQDGRPDMPNGEFPYPPDKAETMPYSV
ncbi:MAG: carbohydrate-binding domain-containing protein [Ruminococcaceae bacterium]|nr:carbohydrate-binding domain-containing protein [Oscillospiraceae bacterium]